MTRRGYHPFTGRKSRAVLRGLGRVLSSRGIDVQWDRELDALRVQVGEDGPVVRLFLGERSVPRLGRVLVMLTTLPEQVDSKHLARLSHFANQANAVLYGTKFYLRPIDDQATYSEVVLERCAVFGGGNLFRLADELDLLVVEYHSAMEQFVDRFEIDGALSTDPVAQARQIGLFDGHPAGEC